METKPGLILAQIFRKKGVSFGMFDRDKSADARTLKASMPEDIVPTEHTTHLMPLDHLPAQFLGIHIPMQHDKRLVHVEETVDKVVIQFEDGASAMGDILVGAEGGRSTKSLVGDTELTGANFSHRLEPGHSAHIIRGERAHRTSINEEGQSTADKPYEDANATPEDMATLAKEKTEVYHYHVRVIVDKVTVERYCRPGIVLQSVELVADQLLPKKVRGEAGVCALTEGLNLGRIITRIRDI
ncbi:putative monooxygenase [Biscogniauxia marginata]|nr:putative monooxygenase [Biscogniauxia marginata]